MGAPLSNKKFTISSLAGGRAISSEAQRHNNALPTMIDAEVKGSQASRSVRNHTQLQTHQVVHHFDGAKLRRGV